MGDILGTSPLTTGTPSRYNANAMNGDERKVLEYTRRAATLTPRQERERIRGWIGFAFGVFVLSSAIWFEHTRERPLNLAIAAVVCAFSTLGLLVSYFGPRR